MQRMVSRIGIRIGDAPSSPAALPHRRTDWLPLLLLPTFVIAASSHMPSWAFMWLLAFSIYGGLKWLTWQKWRTQIPHAGWRSLAYLLAWPGMDAKSFLDNKTAIAPPRFSTWLKAISVTALGLLLFCAGARLLPASQPLLQGWAGMLGVVLALHFGVFKLLALLWQSTGVNAVPIMSAPLCAKSLSEFWGRRWNLGFRDLAYQFVFVPARKKFGTGAASLLVFMVSGLIHDLVISLPAHGGYGLPTLYFAIQGIAAALERTSAGKRLGLRQGWRSRFFMVVVAAVPALLLFHPPFVLRVIIPCMKAVHVL